MMRTHIFSLVLLLPVALPTGAESKKQADCNGKVSGYLQKIVGSVTLYRATGTKSQLDPHDVGLYLCEGDTLECAGDGQAMGYLDANQRSKPRDLCKAGKLVAALGSDSSAGRLLERGHIGGRNKGEDVPIFVPPDHGAILPETFVVRWRTRPPLDTFTAILQDSRGAELGRVPDVNGTDGVLKSQVLKDALLRYQKSDGDHTAKLTFHDKTGPDQSVTFTVLTEEQESDLKRQLAEVSTPVDSFHYVERAAVFESFKLYDQVAAEYDSALKGAPESRYLLQATLNAYARIGDFQTARSLRDRLDKVEGDD